MFNKIVNPETGRLIRINSTKGKKVIQGYKQYGGLFGRKKKSAKKSNNKNNRNNKPRLKEFQKKENTGFLGLRNPFQPAIEVSKSLIKRYTKNNEGIVHRPTMIVTNNNTILTHNNIDNIYIVNPKNGEITNDLKIRDKNKQGKGFTLISGITLNSNNTLLAASDYSGFIKIINVKSGECIEIRRRTFKRCENVDPKGEAKFYDSSVGRERNNIEFSKDGKLLITSSPQKDTGIDVWDYQNRLLKFNIETYISLGNKLKISPNSKYLATTHNGGIIGNFSKIKIWDLKTAVLYKEFNFGRGTITDMCFNNKGDKLITAENNQINIWDIEKGESIQELDSDGHVGKILSIDISDDDKTIVSGGMDKSIIVWNLELGQEMFTLTGHDGPVYDVKFSKNNEIFSLSYDNTLSVWKLPIKI